MKLFWKALKAKLIADATLLAFFTDSKQIYRGFPKKGAVYPALSFTSSQSTPTVFNGPSNVKTSTIDFHCCAKKDLTVIDIADRISLLLDNGVTNYWFDITNADICNGMTNFRFRDTEPEFDEDLDIYIVSVVADFYWYLK